MFLVFKNKTWVAILFTANLSEIFKQQLQVNKTVARYSISSFFTAT